MKNLNTEDLSFAEACEIYKKNGIACEYQNGTFKIWMVINGKIHLRSSDLMIAPLRTIKLISKTSKPKNAVQMFVATPDFQISTTCNVTHRTLLEMSWLSEEISCGAGLMMNASSYKPYLDCAIKMCKILPEVKVATQSGWVDGNYVFGSETICKTETPQEEWQARSEYTLTEARIDKTLPDSEIATKIVDFAFRLFRPGAVATIFSIGYQAYLYEDLRDRESEALLRLTPQIIAPSNSGKTTVLEKIICPALKSFYSISAQCTPIALSGLLKERFSRPLLFEDINPQMDAQIRKQLEETALRSVGDLNGQRMTAHDIRNGAHPISTIAFFTTEDYRITGVSSIARSLPIEIQFEQSTWEMIGALSNTIVATFYYKLLAFFIHNERFNALEASFYHYRQTLHVQFDKLKYLPRIIDNLATVLAGWSLIVEWVIAAAPELSKRIAEITSDLESFLEEMAAKQQERIRDEMPDTLFLLELWHRYHTGKTRFIKVTSEGRSVLHAEGFTAKDVIEGADYLYLCSDIEDALRFSLGGKKVFGRLEVRRALKNSNYLIPPISTSNLSVQMQLGDSSPSFIRLDKNKVFDFFNELN